MTSKTNRPALDRTAKRLKRPPVNGKGDVLTLSGQDDRYVYRIFNDKGTRIATHKDYGWEPCSKDDIEIGTKNALHAGDLATVTVDSSTGEKGLVMRLRKDWYDEDQKAKQDAIDETEKSITGESEKDGNYGKVSIE